MVLLIVNGETLFGEDRDEDEEKNPEGVSGSSRVENVACLSFVERDGLFALEDDRSTHLDTLRGGQLIPFRGT